MLALSMPVERVYAHPDVHADQGRVALKRGPIVYCVEAVDNAVPPHRLALPRDEALAVPLRARPSGWDRDLERHGRGGRAGRPGALSDRAVAGASAPFKAVPYHVWDHREAGEMVVWLREA